MDESSKVEEIKEPKKEEIKRPKKEETEVLEWDNTPYEQYAPALKWARERGLRALQATRATPVGPEWGEILLPAAQQLVEALTSVADSNGLWQALG